MSDTVTSPGDALALFILRQEKERQAAALCGGPFCVQILPSQWATVVALAELHLAEREAWAGK